MVKIGIKVRRERLNRGLCSCKQLSICPILYPIVKTNHPNRPNLASAQHGFVGKGILVFLLMAAVALTVVAFVFGVIVPPGSIGVRLVSFGPSQGFADRGLKPGYHWRIPWYSDIYVVPQTLTVLNFNSAPDAADGDKGGSTPLEIPTADRATVRVDLSVISRIFSEPGTDDGRVHGGPADLLKIAGLSAASWQNRIRRAAEDALRKTLGTLSTAEFYNPTEREQQITEAGKLMNAALNPMGIEIDGVLLRRYTYEDVIEKAIFGKNLQELERELAQKEGEFAKAEAEVKQAAAQGDAKITTLQVDGDNRVLVLRSEGDLYLAEQQAEGDLAVAKARAEVDRLRASALAKSIGADIYVARELAPLLGSLKGGVVTDLNPYDLNAWMDKLGVKEELR